MNEYLVFVNELASGAQLTALAYRQGRDSAPPLFIGFERRGKFPENFPEQSNKRAKIWLLSFQDNLRLAPFPSSLPEMESHLLSLKWFWIR
jgi:hypothetical protein